MVTAFSASLQSVSRMGLVASSLRVPGQHAIAKEGTRDSIPASRMRRVPGRFHLCRRRSTLQLETSRAMKLCKCCIERRPGRLTPLARKPGIMTETKPPS